METETIGSRIRAARKEMGYSQEELAALLYMKKTTICKYEKDLHDIPSSVIVQLARILHTSPNYLLLGEGKANRWKDDMICIIEEINSPIMRQLAMEQMRSIVKYADKSISISI